MLCVVLIQTLLANFALQYTTSLWKKKQQQQPNDYYVSALAWMEQFISCCFRFALIVIVDRSEYPTIS